ncbi:sel1 repeat family protein [Arthrobacter sp. ISL-85]|nr:hypothetical protein [Arthrobacter sp. ISL-85]MBT2568684.1 sel1 repeat family protein [Arthrobacter sp. ISL-85]
MTIQDRAINLLAELQSHGVGSRPICFVTHSMGGLIVKEMLLLAAEGLTNYTNFADAAKGVVFLSTPHNGSGLATAATALKRLYRSTSAVKGLERNGAHLRQLGDRYRDWCNEVGLPNLVLFETHPTRGVRVVDESSANPGLAHVRPIPVDANHLNISKPEDRDSLVYKQVKYFLEELLNDLQRIDVSPISKINISSSTETRPLAETPEPFLLPLDKLDPFDLEIHPSISPESHMGDLPKLTRYVERPHDVKLGEIFQSAESGENAIVVLVGSSSSGKTRAAWEAVSQLPPSWNLWHPLVPMRPRAVVNGIASIPPRTVIWLNELQHYILTYPSEVGEEVAARLRMLLRDKSRGPILVVGTIWPEYLARISTQPAAGEPDPHSQARSLVTDREIRVPTAFTPAQLEMANEAGDPRLKQALASSASAEITQYLAGAPALLERYEAAPAAARAVVKVAIDAERLGQAETLNRSFLEQAAVGYLSDNEWHILGDDWLDQALEYSGGICRGATGLLVSRRLRPTEDPKKLPQFILADYVAQWGRRVSCFEVPPAAFWEAGLKHLTTPEQLISLGDAAASRWRIRHAAMLYQRAIDAGDPDAFFRMGELEESRGETARAFELFLKGANAGNLGAQLKVGDNLSHQGHLTDAKHWLRAAANQGEFRALQSLAQIAEAAGDDREAVGLLQEAVWMAGLSASSPLRQLARLRERLGQDTEAEALRKQSRAGIQTVMRRSLADMAQRRGGIAALERECLEQVSAAQDEGRTVDSFHLELLAEIYEESGEGAKAEGLADLIAERGSMSALLALVAERFNKGDKREAERLARKAADGGDSYGLHELARCSPDNDRLQQMLKFGLEPNGQISSTSV